MRKKTVEAIKKHVISKYPDEACGFVVRDGRAEKFVPVDNVSADPTKHFKISPEDYARVEEQYQIMAIVHSHPDESAQPSAADKVVCEGSGLPWVIVSVYKDTVEDEVKIWEIVEVVPEGYEAPLEGRPFFHGVLDCYTLVQDYYKEKLGITLPYFERKDKWWEDREGESLYLKGFEEAGFQQVVDGTLKEHDVILMEIGSNCGPNHAGIYMGDNIMLHHFYGSPSTKAVYGGSYQYATRMIVRHKDLA